MAALKPGRLADFTGSMAQAMEQALASEWQASKGTPLPALGQEDRRLLFVAIAQGVLRYLKAHESELMKTLTLDGGGIAGTTTVTALELNAVEP